MAGYTKRKAKKENFSIEQSGQAHFNFSIPSLMRGLHALHAERGQLLLTASAHASAYPPEGFVLQEKLSCFSVTRYFL